MSHTLLTSARNLLRRTEWTPNGTCRTCEGDRDHGVVVVHAADLTSEEFRAGHLPGCDTHLMLAILDSALDTP